MEKFIASLNITNVPSDVVKMKSLIAGDKADMYCDCHCCDGCDVSDEDA